ncbi:hypothetical protein [Streptomyces sp. AS58]|uniref:hypothetical protein n=1 Tax=Streptomyces sp. AS58 TaxID=1519489 RepID=UPI000A4F2A00|nr:hypothetical protein [Streptomyces sp. AS58]
MPSAAKPQPKMSPPTELRAWLTLQHITTWRAAYHPRDLEIDDLIEYVRVRKHSLLRALLKDGEIAIEVEGRLARPSVAKLRWTDVEPTNETDVTNDQGGFPGPNIRGRPRDVVAILKSGLPISVTLQGTPLLKSRARGQR